MNNLVNVLEFMQTVVDQRMSLENLVDRALRKLYSLEVKFYAPHLIDVRNDIRIIVAYVKILYDYGQQMALARTYLLHKIKLHEVRENDLHAEISVIRDETPLKKDGSSSLEGKSFETNKNDDCQSEDNELSIILDTRMIRDIDVSRNVLHDISKLISDKKEEILQIERSMEGISVPILSPSYSDALLISMPAIESTTACDSGVLGGVPDMRARSSSRVEGALYTPSNYNEMDMSLESNKTLPPQGEFGAPSGRHGGEPDAAGSASCEGTAGVVSASAPVVLAATAEHINVSSEEIISHLDTEVVEKVDVHKGGEKRKASVSPSVDRDEAENIVSRRPTKTRILASRSDSELSFERLSPGIGSRSLTKEMVSSESDTSNVPEVRRSNLNKTQADFSQLAAARKKKVSKLLADVFSDSEPDSTDRIIDPIVKRIREEEMQAQTDRSSSKGSEYIGSDVKYSSDCSLSSEDKSLDRSKGKSSGKGKNKDPTVKSSATKGNRKPATPAIVTRAEAAREIRFTRRDWLKMDGAELGARCLDYLEEWERQRTLSSNISGMVAGRMRQSKAITTEITKALIEKITTVGDVYRLRIENQSLSEELDQIKRKEEAQNLEIKALRKMVSNLEREVRSLKDGFGPFAAVVPAPPRPMTNKRQKTSEKSIERERERKTKVACRDSSMQVQSIMDVDVDVDAVANSTPGCSTDAEYMHRHEWPDEAESIPWSSRAVPEKQVDNNEILTSKNSLMKLKSKLESNDGHGSHSTRIRIIEDRQIAPPTLPHTNSEWTSVNSKRKTLRREVVAGPLDHAHADVATPSSGVSRRSTENRGRRKPARKLVRPAVVTITNKPGGASYAEILTRAREKVSLKDIGIGDTLVRRALNGAIIIEVPGPSGKQLASVLSSRLADALGEDAKVTNPVAVGEIRLRGIDPSTSTEDIVDALAVLSGCNSSEIKVSPISNMRDGLGIAWVKFPLEFALKIAERGFVRLGWTSVRVELLKKRPIQCFRCWHFGHVQNNCKSSVSRFGVCFRCGETGHIARDCKAGMPKCIVCVEIGKEAKHRLGSPLCLSNQGFPSGVQQVKRSLSDSARRSRTEVK